MYDFAVLALIALAIVKVVDFLGDNVPALQSVRSIMTFLAGFGAVWMLDYSIFDSWGISVRSHSAGMWMTGFMVCGATVAWRAVFAYLTHDRAESDESLGAHRSLHAA